MHVYAQHSLLSMGKQRQGHSEVPGRMEEAAGGQKSRPGKVEMPHQGFKCVFDESHVKLNEEVRML